MNSKKKKKKLTVEDFVGLTRGNITLKKLKFSVLVPQFRLEMNTSNEGKFK